MKAIVDDTIDDDGSDEDFRFTILRVSGETLKKVVEYCEYYEKNGMSKIELPIKTKDLKEVLGGPDDEHAKWYSNFADVDIKTSLELFSAANYLEIPPLMDLAAFRLYVNFDGKSYDDMKTMFHVSSDPVAATGDKKGED